MNKNTERERRNIARLRPHLAGCTVLLKYNGKFPLEAPCPIAAYGNGVRYTIKGGTGSGEVNSRYFVDVETGLTDAGFKITTKEWLNAYDRIRAEAKRAFIESVRAKAKREKQNILAASMGCVMMEPEYGLPLDGGGDAAVYVLSRISGEGNDRLAEPGDFKLTEAEVRDILALDRTFERFMLVINTGGPVDLTPVRSVGNILVLSQLGVETGSALADILLGRAVPSGKLTTTWASYDAYPASDFGQIDDTVYGEGIFVGYRYFDAAGVEPLYPFGFGLSYTTFRVEPTGTECGGREVRFAAKVTNTGRFPGRETVQLYLGAPAGTLVKEPRSLAGFAKTAELQPGETAEVRIAFDPADLASFDPAKAAYVLEEGDYVLYAGTNSRALTPVCVLALSETVTVRRVRSLLDDPGLPETAPEGRADAGAVLPEDLPRLALDPEKFETEEVRYGALAAVPEVLEGLSDEELALLNIGAFDPEGGLLSVIGNASKSVAGAAGETTARLQEKGIGTLVMADGPAGLRLSRAFYVDRKGVHAIGASFPESLTDFLPPIVQKFLNRKPRIPRNAEVGYQYTTALPIGTALAQSWDTGFAELCGDIVGEEMEEFGVHLWLAPGMNLHRNVLCGRNFEYFSEDPLITGAFAAALTRGVQAHKGCGVTVKHYAANNQETNRYGNNSVVSERAMRELYLRGFERCIRKSKPLAVMTSYNLLNGIHTSERGDLCKDILRDEFGFTGLVMTDWIVASGLLIQGDKYPAPDAAKVARAGQYPS